MAAAVVASKGHHIRQQLDAGGAKRDAWATVVAPIFNDEEKTFPLLTEGLHLELNPDLHPNYQLGDKLSSKFSEVSTILLTRTVYVFFLVRTTWSGRQRRGAVLIYYF